MRPSSRGPMDATRHRRAAGCGCTRNPGTCTSSVWMATESVDHDRRWRCLPARATERMDASLDTRDVVGGGQLIGDAGDLDADIDGTYRPEPTRDEIPCDRVDVVAAKPSARQRHKWHMPGGRHAGGVTGPHESHNARHPMRQVHMST